MLIDELCSIVDLVVDDDEDVLLGVVLSNILVSELLGRHCGGGGCWRMVKLGGNFFLRRIGG